MDTDSGRFVDDEQAQSWMQRISVGEVIKIKGEECEVVELGERTITLKLLSADERLRMQFKDIPTIDPRESLKRDLERKLRTDRDRRRSQKHR